MKQETQQTRPAIACFGEVLWDSLPHGLFLGGAPTNVAYNLARLGHPSLLISAVGNDELGRQAINRIERSNIDISCVQISDNCPTGIADIFLDDRKDAEYDIHSPSAWDEISYTQLTQEKLAHCSAIVFGSLACRSELSRATLDSLLASFKGIKLCDINIRKPWTDRSNLLHLAQQASVLKVNEHELFYLSGLEPTNDNIEEALETLGRLCPCEMIAVTRGSSPAIYYDRDKALYCPTKPNLEVADTIGAGDAFCAGFASALTQNASPQEALEKGVLLGGIVASHHGAQPAYKVP